MQGILIDCYHLQDKIVLWIKQGNKNVRVEDIFVPKIYARTTNLNDLKQKLYAKGIFSCYVKKKCFTGKEVWMLEVLIPSLSKYRSMVSFIERLTCYDAELYNADIALEEYYFWQKQQSF